MKTKRGLTQPGCRGIERGEASPYSAGSITGATQRRTQSVPDETGWKPVEKWQPRRDLNAGEAAVQRRTESLSQLLMRWGGTVWKSGSCCRTSRRERLLLSLGVGGELGKEAQDLLLLILSPILLSF